MGLKFYTMMEAREGTQSRNWRQGPWRNNTYWFSRARVQSVSLHSPESDAAYSGLDPRTTKIMKTQTCLKTNLIETIPLSIQSFS